LRHFEGLGGLARVDDGVDDDASAEIRLAATLVSEVTQALRVGPFLTACAGVAIVKPHFPFALAYDLAEELLRSAKSVKHRLSPAAQGGPKRMPASALDFHVLYDAGRTRLDTLRVPVHHDGEILRL